MAGHRYVFSEFVLDLRRASLTRGDAQVSLRPKAFDALKYLVENPGRVVTKDELIDAVWPDVVVTDDSLSKCIQEVREALGDKPPVYVKTVPRRGYLFDVAVAHESESEPAAATHVRLGASASETTPDLGAAGRPADSRNAAGPVRAGRSRPFRVATALGVIVAVGVVVAWLRFNGASAPPDAPPSIAVLPFLNLSSDQDQEYFSDGLAEELLNKLAKIERLRVTARTSSFAFKGSEQDVQTIAARLGVDNVVEGSVRKSGNSIRITAQLIDAELGTHLWSETYERELTDIFAIQDDIAESIAAALSLTLGIAEREALKSGTDNVEAFDHYLAGTALLNEFGSDQTARGLEQLERATEIDPGYADAWAVLALAYLQNAYLVTLDFDVAERQAEEAARRALALNENMAPAHAALAHVYVFRRDWLRADQAAARAVSIPTDFTPAWDYAEILQAAGYLEESLEYRRQARQAMMFNVGPASQLALAYHEVGDDESAAAELSRAESLVGARASIDGTRLWMAMANGDEDTVRAIVSGGRLLDSAIAQQVELMLAAPETAAASLRRLRDASSATSNLGPRLGPWAAYFDEPELAVELIRADALRAPLNIQPLWSPVMRDARRTQAFEDLVEEMGLVEFWRARGWPTLCRPLAGEEFECY